MNKYIIVTVLILVIAGLGFFLMSMKPSTISQQNSSTTTVQTSGKNVKTTFTLAQVSAHKDASSCWTAIDNKVYDVTSFINRHPGGSDRILSICGIDGSAAFNGQHSGAPRPAAELQAFYIGNLTTQ